MESSNNKNNQDLLKCIELYGNKTNDHYLHLLEQTQSRAVKHSNNKFETDLLLLF